MCRSLSKQFGLRLSLTCCVGALVAPLDGRFSGETEVRLTDDEVKCQSVSLMSFAAAEKTHLHGWFSPGGVSRTRSGLVTLCVSHCEASRWKLRPMGAVIVPYSKTPVPALPGEPIAVSSLFTCFISNSKNLCFQGHLLFSEAVFLDIPAFKKLI